MRSLCVFVLLALLPVGSAAIGAPWVMPKDDFGGAIPLKIGHWFSADDYPYAASRSDEQGYVTVSFTIALTDG